MDPSGRYALGVREPDTVEGGSPGPSELLGRLLDGRYQIEVLLGEGGIGQVFRATDRRLSRAVAIKVMHPQYVARTELRARFEREARSLAALSHPNVVGVVDYGVDGDIPFLVMDLLEGRTLEAAIADGLPPDRVLPIVRDVLRAVAYAHAQGVVHRDLKPANVFLQHVPEIGDVVRVLDFGLAKFIDAEPSGPTLTRAGTVLGTPAYMSPEQATGGEVDARADVYSLGIMLFELVTGERPFQASDGPELLRQHLLTAMPPMSGKRTDLEILPELDALVQHASAKSRTDRFKDASEMAAALDTLPAKAIRELVPAGGIMSARTGPSPRPSSPATDATLAAPSDVGATLASRPSEFPGRPDVPAGATGEASARTLELRSAEVGEPRATLPNRPAVRLPQEAQRPVRASASWLWKGGLAALTLVTFVAIGSWWLLGSRPTPTNAPAIAPPPTPIEPAANVTPSPRGEPVAPIVEAAGPSPFDAPTPPQLAPIEARVRAGRGITDDQRRALRQYSRNHPHDPRAWLLMGHADFAAGARTDACDRYDRAFHSDEAARNDEVMLHNLLVMTGHHAVTTVASRMVREIYGARALPALPAVEQELAGDRDAVRRLRALGRRLEHPE